MENLSGYAIGNSPGVAMERIEFQLNGKGVRLEVDGDRKLLRVLRSDLGLPGKTLKKESPMPIW